MTAGFSIPIQQLAQILAFKELGTIIGAFTFGNKNNFKLL